MDVGWILDGWMDVGWLEKAELKPTQPILAGAWLSLAKSQLSPVQLELGHECKGTHYQDTYQVKNKLYWVDDGWMLDVGWLEKAELKPTQPSLAGAWQYFVKEVF